jgi:glucose/arabinose dehydrogenase
MKPVYTSIIILLSIISYSSCKDKKSDSPEMAESNSDSIRVLRNDLNYPWEIQWGKDNHIWMTERGGKLSRVDPVTGNTVFSFTINEVESRGEGGLLGMALHPGFLNNGYVYLAYNYTKAGEYLEKLVRYTFSSNTLSQPMVIIDNIKAAGIHNGSRIWITEDPEPKIFMTTGDASQRDLSPLANNRNGKILRLNIDGSIPSDNPFPGNPVWSYGHRNPQGLVMVNKILYAAEHGQNIEDELNIIEKGRNYGWPEVEGPCNNSEQSYCSSNNVKEPIWSSGNNTIAVCGLDYYNNDRLSAWKNSLLMLTLKNSSLRQLKLSSDGQTIVSTMTWYSDKWGRLRDLCVSPDGKVYICTSNGSNDVLVEISQL